MCDRYGGALAWDRYCYEREAAYRAHIANATCADCSHCRALDGGKADALRAFDRMLENLDVWPKKASHSVAAIVGNARQRIAEACEVWVCDAYEMEEIEPGRTPLDVDCDWFEPRD